MTTTPLITDNAYDFFNADGSLSTNQLALIFVMIITFFFEFYPKISPFVARKGTHMSSGIMVLFITHTPAMTMFILAWAVFVVTQAWSPIRKWRFAHKKGDIGITFFGVIISVWALFQWDYKHLIPIFFCDPLAAIVGKSINSPRWYQNKTIAGTAACFVTCLLVLPFTFQTITIPQQIVLSAILALAEAISGDYDNVIMAIPIVAFGIISGENKLF